MSNSQPSYPRKAARWFLWAVAIYFGVFMAILVDIYILERMLLNHLPVEVLSVLGVIYYPIFQWAADPILKLIEMFLK